MKIAGMLSLGLVSSIALAQESPQPQHFDEGAMQTARARMHKMHGGSFNYLLIGERLEQQSRGGEQALVWEAQGWFGYDLDKLWLKTEGHYDTEAKETEEFEFQALYSRAISPFWDLQAGLRHDFKPDSGRSYAVLGLMGLAPYWFEMDNAVFLSDEGDLSARVEAEYELRFTQRLILQPRLELNYSFSDDLDTGIGQGLNKLHLGLRLRYEFRREIAPYLGIAWENSYGRTAKLLQAQGKDPSEARFVAGFRLWY